MCTVSYPNSAEPGMYRNAEFFGFQKGDLVHKLYIIWHSRWHLWQQLVIKQTNISAVKHINNTPD